MSEPLGAVVLAAGAASRFGAPKQLLEVGGVTLVDRACAVARRAGCRTVLRVLGAHAAEILARPQPAGVITLVHGEWQQGMGASLAAGVTALLERDPGCEALHVLLADQPAIGVGLLERMRARLRPPIRMVLCQAGGVSGPPALFDASCFPELRRLSGDRGARALAAEDPAGVARVDAPEAAWDIDSPEAWRRFTAGGAANCPP